MFSNFYPRMNINENHNKKLSSSIGWMDLDSFPEAFEYSVNVLMIF